jgi:CRP-like cAMP-binding protein
VAKLNLFQSSEDTESFSKGDTIFHEGDRGDAMYVVQVGEVELSVGGKLIEVATPGDVFGEMALVDSRPRSASAVARSDCRLVPISARRFEFLVQQTPGFALQVMRVMVDRIRRRDGAV